MNEEQAITRVTWLAGPRDASQEEVQNPDWKTVEEAILALNGDDCTLLILGIADPVPHMGIGGGGDGRYIVYETSDNAVFSNLIICGADQGTYWMKAGGQYAHYPARQCATLSDALRAAYTYVNSGLLDSNLSWEKQ